MAEAVDVDEASECEWLLLGDDVLEDVLDRLPMPRLQARVAQVRDHGQLSLQDES